MFQETYRNAYKKLNSPVLRVEKLFNYIDQEEYQIPEMKIYIVRPVAVCVLCFLLIGMVGTPVLAKEVPSVYRVLEKYAPSLLAFVLSEEKTDTKAGITLQLEAVKIDGNTAEAIVSFTDAEGENYISGLVDMYDSYNLHSYSAQSNVGGCSFIEYDEETDKAYFSIDMSSTENAFEKDLLSFQVYQLLTDCRDYIAEIPKEDMEADCNLKKVSLNGSSGGVQTAKTDALLGNGDMFDPRSTGMVMDISLENVDPNALEVLGVMYEDGILRVQVCRGYFEEASRYMDIYLQDEEGNQIQYNHAVCWQEDINEQPVSLDEFWFDIEEETLENYNIYGDAMVRAGSVKGDWEITFSVE